MDYDATSLYPSAMWVEESIYLKIETGYAFNPHINDESVEKCNNQKFTNVSAILKVLYTNPSHFISRQLPVR